MNKVTIIVVLAAASVGRNGHAQSNYVHDRVYTANQISNTVSVVDPSHNRFLGEIILGQQFPNILSPLYKGEALVHGLRYSPQKKLLAAVSIGSNSVTFISTETNKVLGKVYLGRSPHEPTFTPDGNQVWISVRGEAYVSVVDVNSMKEVKQVPVADGPGMIAFTPDGKEAYVCSSFTPEVDVVNCETYEIINRIPVVSPFSPNIFASPDGKFIALTHKDVGKVTVISTGNKEVLKVINTGPITNHVTFTIVNKRLLMFVTVGRENKVKVFDVVNDFSQIKNITVGALPHGLWASPDGRIVYVGLEYADQVQRIDTKTMTTSPAIQIGQSPQALVYAENAVSKTGNTINLSPPFNPEANQIVTLHGIDKREEGYGRLVVRSIGLTDMVEQIFTSLEAGNSYTLTVTNSDHAPFTNHFAINTFTADGNGKYNGQSTGLIKS
jgi:YVTN family beta-propeller protein